MKELYKAIFARFNTVNTLNTALSNNLYPHEAEQSTVSFPYGTYFKIFGANGYDFTDETEDILIQFSLFSEKNSPDEVNLLYGYLKDLYDDAPLVVDGYRVLRVQRMDDSILRDEEQNTWAYHVDYSIWLEKDRWK